MGDALRHLLSRHLFLCAQHIGDVVHDHEMAVQGTAQLGDGKNQMERPRELCASTSVDAAGKRRLRRRTRPISSADSVGNSD